MATLESLLIKIGIDLSSIPSDMRDVGTEIRRGADRIDGNVPVAVDDTKVKGGLNDVESSVERMLRDIDSDVPVAVDDSKVKGGLSDVESDVERSIRTIDGDVPITVDDSKVTGGLNGVESSVERKVKTIDSDVPVTVDDAKLRGGLNDVESSVERRVKTIDSDVPVGVDDSMVRRDLNGVESSVERKVRSIDGDVPVGVDQGHVRSELNDVERSVNRRVRAMDPDIDVDVDQDRVHRGFSALSARLTTRAGALGLTMGSALGRGMASGIALAATVVAGAAVLLGKSAFDEAQDAVKIGEQTEAVIKSTGKAANITADQVGKLAEALSLKAGVDDEEIQAGANMLLTFKNVRNEAGKGNDIFNQATSTILDMSVAMGMPMKNAAIMLGKALNDPIAGLSAMSRVGITFTEQQEKQITKLVESGNTMKAQKIILGELSSEFAGSAAAQATAADKAEVAWGNLMEQLGVKLMPVLNRLLVWFVSDIVPALKRFASWFQANVIPAIATLVAYIQANWPKISKTIKDTMADVTAIVRGVVDLVTAIWRRWGDDITRFTTVYFGGLFKIVQAAMKIIRGVIDLFVGLITGDWGRAWKGIKEIFGGVWDSLKAQVKMALGIIQNIIRSAWDAVKHIFKSAWDAIAGLVGKGVGKVRDLVSSVWNKIRDLTSSVWNKVRDVVDGVWDRIRTMVSTAAGKVRDVVQNAWDKIRTATSTIWNKVRDVIDGVWDKIRTLVSSAVDKVRTAVSNAWGKIRDLTSTLWGKVRDVIDNIWNRIKTLVTNAVDRVKTLVSNAWDRIKTVTTNVWGNIRTAVSNVWDKIKTLVTNAVDRVKTVVTNAWDRVKTATSNIWGNIHQAISNAWQKIKNVFDALKTAVGKIPGAFEAAKKGIGRVWDGIKAAAARPVNFVINQVYNNGIRKALNLIPGVNLGAAHTIEFATGGWTGPGSKYQPAGIVHADEFVIRKEARRRIERTNPGFLDHLNKTGVPGHAKGGLVNPMKRVYVDGEPLTAVHAAQLLIAGQLMGTRQSVMQGSWQAPTSYSGTSHTGPGVADTSPGSFRAQWAQRRAGIAAWARNIPGAHSAGSGAHVHGVSMFSAPGNSQLAAYKGGGDGLGGSDYGPRPGLMPGLMKRLKRFGDLTSIGGLSGIGLDFGMFGQPFSTQGSTGSFGGFVMGAIDAVPDFINGLQDIWDDIHSMDDRSEWAKLFAHAPASVMDEVKEYGLEKIKDAGGWAKQQALSTVGKMGERAKKAWDTIKGIDVPGFAKGGIVTSPTLGMLAERGPEAVVPLPDGVARAVNNTGRDRYVTPDQMAAMGNNQAIIDLLERLVAAAESGGDVFLDGRVLAGEVTRRQRADSRGQRVAAGTAGWSS